jgi:hypothetical protein
MTSELRVPMSLMFDVHALTLLLAAMIFLAAQGWQFLASSASLPDLPTLQGLGVCCCTYLLGRAIFDDPGGVRALVEVLSQHKALVPALPPVLLQGAYLSG